jgi:hypothetical protein
VTNVKTRTQIGAFEIVGRGAFRAGLDAHA